MATIIELIDYIIMLRQELARKDIMIKQLQDNTDLNIPKKIKS